MENNQFIPIQGIIQDIIPMNNNCCQQMISLSTPDSNINFILSRDTYVVDQTRLIIGMSIVAFYDSSKPVPLIFPPQYQAVVISPINFGEFITLDYFDSSLVNSNNSLKLVLSPNTEVITANGQDYYCDLNNQLLLVFYSITTRSIPPITTPHRIIVMC